LLVVSYLAFVFATVIHVTPSHKEAG